MTEAGEVPTSMVKQKVASQINRGRGRMSRRRSHRPPYLYNLRARSHKLRVGAVIVNNNNNNNNHSSSSSSNNNNNVTKRGRGRPPGTGKRQLLLRAAQLEKQFEASKSGSGCLSGDNGVTAQMKPTVQSGIQSFHRPLTRSQSNRFTNTLIFFKEAAQQKSAVFQEDNYVLQNGSESIPNIEMSTFVESVQVEVSPAENPALSEFEGNDYDRMSMSQVQGADIDKVTTGACVEAVPNTGENSEVHPTYVFPITGMKSDDTFLLQAIYNKYGDITRGCDLESEIFKRSCLLGICWVVQKLQATSIDDISSDYLAELYSSIKDAENLKFDVKWLHQRVMEIQECLRSRDKLKTMEEAQRMINVREESLKKRLEMNKLEIAKLEQEIETLKAEQTVKKSREEEVKALTEDIKSSYHSCPKYLIDWLL